METLPAVANWHEGQAFCERMNKLIPVSGNYEWRLPTEAEWEFACKGNSIGQLEKIIQESDGNERTAFIEPSKRLLLTIEMPKRVHPLRAAKTLLHSGLLDMHGNFWEWCMDSVSENKVSLKGIAEQIFPTPSERREIGEVRGGSHKTSWQKCRSTYRGASPPDIDTNDVGFRIVLGRKLNLERMHPSPFHKKLKGLTNWD